MFPCTEISSQMSFPAILPWQKKAMLFDNPGPPKTGKRAHSPKPPFCKTAICLFAQVWPLFIAKRMATASVLFLQRKIHDQFQDESLHTPSQIADTHCKSSQGNGTLGATLEVNVFLDWWDREQGMTPPDVTPPLFPPPFFRPTPSPFISPFSPLLPPFLKASFPSFYPFFLFSSFPPPFVAPSSLVIWSLGLRRTNTSDFGGLFWTFLTRGG